MHIDLVYGPNLNCFVRDTAAVLENAFQYVCSTMGLKARASKGVI